MTDRCSACACPRHRSRTGIKIGAFVAALLLMPVAAMAAGPVFSSNSAGSTVHVTNTNASGTGVFAIATANTGIATGVVGRTNSTSGRGVYGLAVPSSGTASGVVGSSASTNGRGVYGIATGSGGATRGVYGRTTSPNGVGVYGHATGALACCLGTYGVYSNGALGVSNGSKLICTGCVIPRDLSLPVVSAYDTSGQTVPNNTVTTLTFDADNFDLNGLHDETGTPTQLDAQVAGFYQVTASINWASNTSGVRTLKLVKNGSTTLQEDSEDPGSSGISSQSISTLVQLAAGDFLTLTGFQTSGGALTTAGGAAETFTMSFVTS